MSGAEAAADAADIVLILNADCWAEIFAYLDLENQINFSKSCKLFYEIFGNYARRHYAHIDTSSAKRWKRHFGNERLEKLLQKIGKYVRSYATPRNMHGHHHSYAYSGDESALDRAWQEIYRNRNQRRCGTYVVGMYFEEEKWRKKYPFKIPFEIVLANCRNLESFEFGEYLLPHYHASEKICQLPALQHIFIWIKVKLRSEFLDALEAKPGAPLQSLSIKGLPIPKKQIERICNIISLKELSVSSLNMPLSSLLKLQQLEALHITLLSIQNAQLMELIKGLPHLHTLGLRECSLITEEVVIEAREWMSKNKNFRRKLTIYVQGSGVNWQHFEQPPNFNVGKHLVDIVNKQEEELVPLTRELSQGYS